MTIAVRTSAVRITLALVALAVAIALTPADGTGVRADDLVLALVAAAASVRAFTLTRGMAGRPALPWRLVASAAALFAVSGLLTGSGLAGAVQVGDALLVVALVIPPTVCVLLARQVPTSTWVTVLVDGSCVVLALLVIEDVLGLSAGGGAHAWAVGYGAVALGSAGALGVESTRELRRSVSTMIAASAFLALAVGLVGATGPLLWQALGGVAVVLCLEAGVLAVASAPRPPSGPVGIVTSRPLVNRAGLVVTWTAFGGVPAVLLLAVARGQQLTPWTVSAVALVVLLLTTHGSLRARAGNRLVTDLVRSEEDLRELVEGSSDGIALVDDDLRLQFTSPAARGLLGLPADGGPTRTLLDLVVPEDRERVLGELREGTGTTLHLRVTRAGGPTELEITHHRREDTQRRVLHLRDVTVRRRRERELERMAFTDHLTRLPNRALLFQEMATAVAGRCLLVLDLDGFKAVNDAVGHEAGDQLLVEVAARLRTAARERDVVCRLGGDEFAVVVEGDRAAAREAAQRIVEALSLPYRTGRWTFAIGASVGVAELRAGGGQLAFREADTALRAAKRAGKGCVRTWDGGGDGELPSGSVSAALAAGQVELRYTLAGVSRLPGRALHGEPSWAHPSGVLVTSAELWLAAGHQGSAAELQTWLLAEITRQAVGTPGLEVAVVDLPAGHLQVDRLVDDVRRALAASGLAADRLVLALTEDALLTSPASLAPALHELHGLGVRLCLADYGMGQTLYAHLARIPLTSVRVDMAALGGQVDQRRMLSIVRSIASGARALGLITVAHGVPLGLADAVLASGVHLLTTEGARHEVTIERVREEFGRLVDGAGPAPAIPRILAG